jgi:FMN phosphatase YigB (HAD superfamily)
MQVIVATNPFFPNVATESRIRWTGLEPKEFELYTTYANSSYTKPNPKYYEEILNKNGLEANECIMVGNDVTEDGAARKICIKTFILTDWLINKENADLNDFPHGSFDDLLNSNIEKI